MLQEGAHDRRPTKTRERGKGELSSGAALATKIRLCYRGAYLILKENKNLKKIHALKTEILTVGKIDFRSFRGKKCNNFTLSCFNIVLNHLLGK